VDILSDALAALRTGRPVSVRTEARAPWSVRFQAVAGAGFHVVLQGTCQLLSPGRESVLLGPGDVVFLRKGGEHVLCDDPTTPAVEFRPEQVDASSPIGQLTLPGTGARTVLLCGAYRLDVAEPHPVLADLPDVVHLPARPGRHLALRSAIEQLAAELAEPRPGSDAVVAALIDMLLLYILRAWADEQPARPGHGWAAALTDPLIAPALRAIHQDPGQPWTVRSLGERVGLSRAAFARRFTALVGEPPLTYLTSWRMTAAGRLLRETTTPLARIAELAGYSSEFAFGKAFKRRYGVPPGAYRRQHRLVPAAG
jgi:AraC-like DNA-binding protein